MPTKVHPVLIDGHWRPARASGTFKAVNPATGEPLPEEYPVSQWTDVEAALEAGRQAASEMARLGPDPVARFLEVLAGLLEGRKDELVAAAPLETALPSEPRLGSVELPRLLDQLRKAAAACRDRTWCRATIDTKVIRCRQQRQGLVCPYLIIGLISFPSSDIIGELR